MKRKLLFYVILIYLSACCSPPSQIIRKSNNKTSFNKEVVESFSWGNSEEELPFVSEEKKGFSSLNSRKKSGNSSRSAAYQRSKAFNKNNSFQEKRSFQAPLKRGSFSWYKVKRGDTLFRIARNHNISLKQLCAVNKIKNPSCINAGMLIKIAPIKSNKNYNPKRTIAKRKSRKRIKKSNKYYSKKDAPDFRWPIKNIKKVKKDGGDGVKSIGIIIFPQGNNSVASAATGIVRKVGYMRGYGNFIIIAHKNRFMTIYANLDIVNVSQGEKVKRGRFIGKLDSHKNNNLHFQINEAGKPRNPLKFLPVKRG